MISENLEHFALIIFRSFLICVKEVFDVDTQLFNLSTNGQRTGPLCPAWSEGTSGEREVGVSEP